MVVVGQASHGILLRLDVHEVCCMAHVPDLPMAWSVR